MRWINTYGPTEASICVTAFDRMFVPRTIYHKTSPSDGPLLTAVSFCSTNDSMRCPYGVPGELYIGGVGWLRAITIAPS